MTVVLTVSAILFGALAYTQLPVNDLPAVDYPVIQVNAGYPGASPETVAATIATPLERQFMQIPGLELVTSRSTQGNCSLTLQFSIEKGIDAAATDVQAAISRATGFLPVDLPSPPTFTKTNPNEEPIIYSAITSDSMPQAQLYDMANTLVSQRISMLNGVSQVRVFGSPPAVRIKANPSALAARGMSMNDLADAIKQGTSYQGAGQFDGPNRTFLLRPQGQLSTAEDYNQLIISMKDGLPIYLRDVAEASDTLQDERVKMHFYVRGREVPKAAVVMAVYRQAGSNAVEVTKSIRDQFPVIRQSLPASVNIMPIYDRSISIVNSVRDVRETLIIAFILVVVVIFMFLGRVTDTLIPVVALPLSLLLTFIVMNMLGYSLDNLSLMALTLAIGFLVDDAIVFLENTVRRMEQFGETPLQASINSAKNISFTILSMTLSLAAVFLPLIFMSGLIGRIFREFAVTICVSILASGIVSLTLTPLMCARMLGQRGHGTKKTWVERVIGGIEHRVLGVYSWSLWFFLRHRWVSLVIWIVCLGGTFYLFQIVPKAFLPIGDSSFIQGLMVAPEGTSYKQMRVYQERGQEAIAKNPAVERSISVTGVSQFLPSNQGFFFMFLKDPEERAPIDQVALGLTGDVSQNLGGAMAFFRPNPVLQISTGAAARQGGQFNYTVSGIDPEEVYTTSQRLIGKLSEQQGKIFANIIPDLYLNTPALKIDIMRDQAASYGVSAQRIEALLRTAYSQNYVYLIKKAQDQYQVILEADDTLREHPEDLQKLYIHSDDGTKLVPLTAVARWTPTVSPQSVNHLNQFTSVTLQFNLMPGVPIGDAVNYIEDVAREIVPTHLRSEFQGEALTFRETIQSLTILMILAVFVMYVILAILYESYIHPITVLSTLPTAMVGGLLTLVVFGQEASLYAFIGLFMLMGIVKKNGIMIVDFARQRVDEGEPAEKAIHDASIDRFRPIIMTTLAAVMGAVPIALGHGADGESRRPLGLVIVGGLIVSQFITLYVTPVIYLYMELFQERVLDRIPFFRSHHAHMQLHGAGAGAGVHRDVVPVLPHGDENGHGNGDGDNGHK
jgi:HAE1 family hydrophobic/amphiphilic exporter-1